VPQHSCTVRDQRDKFGSAASRSRLTWPLRLHRLIEYLVAVTACFDYPLGNLGQLHLAFLR
jgi:hypothetical protein